MLSSTKHILFTGKWLKVNTISLSSYLSFFHEGIFSENTKGKFLIIQIGSQMTNALSLSLPARYRHRRICKNPLLGEFSSIDIRESSRLHGRENSILWLGESPRVCESPLDLCIILLSFLSRSYCRSRSVTHAFKGYRGV